MNEDEFNKERLFDLKDFYMQEFGENREISPATLKSFLNNEDIKKEDFFICVKGLCSYIDKLTLKNKEIDDLALNSLNMMALTYLGVMPNHGNRSNEYQKTEETKDLSVKILKNLLLGRNVDQEVLVDVLAIANDLELTGVIKKDKNGRPIFTNNKDAIKKVQYKYTEFATEAVTRLIQEPDMNRLLMSKFKSFNEEGVYLSTPYKKKKVEFLSKLKSYKEIDLNNIDEIIEDEKNRFEFKDIKMNSPIIRKQQQRKTSSIQEHNNNLFLKSSLNIITQDYWDEKYNNFLKEYNFEKVSTLDSLNQRTKKFFTGKNYEDYGSLFSETIKYTNEAGKVYVLMELPRFSKTVEIPGMPNNDKTYELLAIATKKRGIVKPCIMCYEKEDSDRQLFVESTLKQLLVVGYHIDSISVPKDCLHILNKYKHPHEGFELIDEDDLTEEDKVLKNLSNGKEDTSIDQETLKENRPTAMPLKDKEESKVENKATAATATATNSQTNEDFSYAPINVDYIPNNDIDYSQNYELGYPQNYEDNYTENDILNSANLNDMGSSKPPVLYNTNTSPDNNNELKSFIENLDRMEKGSDSDILKNKLFSKLFASLSEGNKIVDFESKQINPLSLGYDLRNNVILNAKKLLNNLNIEDKFSNELKKLVEDLPNGLSEVTSTSNYKLFEVLTLAKKEGHNISEIINGDVGEFKDLILTVGKVEQKTQEELLLDKELNNKQVSSSKRFKPKPKN